MSDDLDIASFGVVQWSQWGGLSEGSVWSMGIEMGFVRGEDVA
jgi:hypothetical protein